MSWIKEANKIGRYKATIHGFRVYCIKEATHTESIITRDGEQWIRIDFHPGHYVAVDKHSRRLETKMGKVHMYEAIDIQHLKDYYSNNY